MGGTAHTHIAFSKDNVSALLLFTENFCGAHFQLSVIFFLCVMETRQSLTKCAAKGFLGLLLFALMWAPG